MKGKRVLILIGILLALLGTVFALQGAGMLGTGGFMDNNPTYVYVGGALVVVGLLLLAFGVIPRQASKTVSAT
ncbi:MAG TPA: hypothetical protein VGR56_00325 [Nitrososphaerales archaeon]|nr:hypothetical protein [Nitrososphaerales archaeon]